MQNATRRRGEHQPAVVESQYPPLELVNSPNVPTDQAAFYLNRSPQTLREWSCLESGPLRPIRVNSRLAWPVAEIKRVSGVL